MSEVKYANGRSIRLFLMDGEPDGRYQAEISTGITRAYKIPRSLVMGSCKTIDDLNKPAVYFLIGKTEDENNHKNYTVYIGETENPIERFKQHLSNKDFWSETIIMVSSNSFLNKAHVKYLESQFAKIAKDADIYFVEQGKGSTAPKLSDADISDLQVIIRDGKLLLPALGHNFLESHEETANKSSSKLFLKSKSADAQGLQTSHGFVLLKGSKINIAKLDSCPPAIKKARDDFENVIDNGILKADITLRSADYAAKFVCGSSVNGKTSWKNANGKTLKALEIGDELSDEVAMEN